MSVRRLGYIEGEGDGTEVRDKWVDDNEIIDDVRVIATDYKV